MRICCSNRCPAHHSPFEGGQREDYYKRNQPCGNITELVDLPWRNEAIVMDTGQISIYEKEIVARFVWWNSYVAYHENMFSDK
jgi:hypothetical protein